MVTVTVAVTGYLFQSFATHEGAVSIRDRFRNYLKTHIPARMTKEDRDRDRDFFSTHIYPQVQLEKSLDAQCRSQYGPNAEFDGDCLLTLALKTSKSFRKMILWKSIVTDRFGRWLLTYILER
jgi:hypothetical protein